MHLFWVIIGPIMLTSLAEMEDALKRNIFSANEFKIMKDCADSRAIVNVYELQEMN